MDTNSDHPAALDRQITKLWPRPHGREDLLRAGQAVQAMLGSEGWLAVTAVLDAEVATVDRSLDGTYKALDHADYALLHGRRGGLRALKSAADAIVSRAKEAEHELDHENAAETATV